MSEKMMSIKAVAARLNVSYSVIYRLLRVGDMKCHRVGKSARISEGQLDAYLAKGSDSKAPEGAGLDLAIICPKCREVLTKHKSENMVDDVATQYATDCRQCGIRFRYQVVSLEAIERFAEELDAEELDAEEGVAAVLSDLGAERQSAVDGGLMDADPLGDEIERIAGEPVAELLGPPRPPPANPCQLCQGRIVGEHEQLEPARFVKHLFCSTCNPEKIPGLGPKYPIIEAEGATEYDATLAAILAWNIVTPPAPQAGAQGDSGTDTDTGAPEEVTQ